MITIKDVARHAGVSISTVSRVINHSAPVIREKCIAVNRAMKALGYRPNIYAQALVKKQTEPSSVGVLVGKEIIKPQIHIALSEIGKVAAIYGKSLQVNFCGSSTEKTLSIIEKMARDNTLDGCIIAECHLSDMDLVRILRHYPDVILFDRFISVLADQCVYTDFAKTGYRAIEYLYELDHRSITLFIGNELSFNQRLWLEGCVRAAREKRILLAGPVKIDCSPEPDCMLRNEIAHYTNRSSAIVVYNDIMAGGVIKALRQVGKRIPRDISLLASHDTGVASYLDPAVTTFRTPMKKMAEQATKQAMGKNMTGNCFLPERQLFNAEMVFRESVMPPPVYTKTMDVT